jgi:hypothetical protein
MSAARFSRLNRCLRVSVHWAGAWGDRPFPTTPQNRMDSSQSRPLVDSHRGGERPEVRQRVRDNQRPQPPSSGKPVRE